MRSLPLAVGVDSTRAALPKITEKIVASYAAARSINRLDCCPLPNKEAIVEILRDLNEILFPGYRRRDRLNSDNVVYYAGNLIDKIYDALRSQISRALCGGSP
ncbi:MAG: hypothetical protein HUK22_07110, partial [Thermoguttaceae bacterium]|nr:hypothetical protein [Thermoguttaceae bacterium]